MAQNGAKMAQITEKLSEKRMLSLLHPTSSRPFGKAIHLYDNEKNATECDKMQQFFR